VVIFLLFADPGHAADPCLAPEVVESVLTHKDVSRYLHPESPERTPVVVTGPGVESEGSPPAGRVPPFRFEHLSSAPDVAFHFHDCKSRPSHRKVWFEYPVEGLRGTMELVRKPGERRWTPMNVWVALR
jgi:hypothetical protein